MRILHVLFLTLFIHPLFCSAQRSVADHQTWDQLLQKYVNDAGEVDYQAFKNDPALDRYVTLISRATPEKDWSKSEKMAYWINAYNAFTMKLIIDHLPLKSIMDIDDAWNKPFIRIEKQAYTLNQIEHEILREKYFDARIHFGVNCASFSCPKLNNRAFTADKLDEQLDQMTRSFLMNADKNKIESNKLVLSQLFDWYEEDFEKAGGLINFINSYTETEINKNANISFMEYNWSLNAKP